MRCDQCKWWQDIDGEVGECFRLPPVPFILQQHITELGWPLRKTTSGMEGIVPMVDASHFCGEFTDPVSSSGRLQIDRPIRQCPLSARAINCLESGFGPALETVGDLISQSDQQLLERRGLGECTLREIKDMLDRYGLHLLYG